MYDLIVIGAGAAGYTAAIYASRYNMKTLVIGKDLGGLGATAHKIENWPGEISISGYDLLTKFSDHAKNFGVEIKQELVLKIEQSADTFVVSTEKEKFTGKTLILAMGTKHRQLNIPGEEEFSGKGVSYCATCDGAFFRDKTVAIVGGGDSAFTAAVQLSDIAKHVYLTYLEATPKAMPAWVIKVTDKENVTLIPENTITKITGENIVKTVELKNKFQNQQELAVDGVFIEVGVVPNNQLLTDLDIKKTAANYIEVDNKQQTNKAGVFAAGDITNGSGGFSQLTTAAAEGAIAAFNAYKYLKNK